MAFDDAMPQGELTIGATFFVVVPVMFTFMHDPAKLYDMSSLISAKVPAYDNILD